MSLKMNPSDRRAAVHASLAASVGLLMSGCAAGQPPLATQAPAGFTRTDEDALHADDSTLSQRARDLIRIGERGIASPDPAALGAFFHPQFRFHGPGGAEFDREQLWHYFAACRDAFDDFTVTRQAIVSDGADHLATRTRFAGTFARPFSGVPGRPVPPNGRPFENRLINIFRYAPDGRLIEEWVQYDVQAFMAQLQA